MPTVAEYKAQIDKLTKELQTSSARVAELDKQRQDLQGQVTQLTAQLNQFKSASAPKVQVEALASSVRTLIEGFHAEGTTPPPGGVATALRSVDLEVRGLVEVQDNKTVLAVPSLEKPLDPNALSTLKLSFAAVPPRKGS